MLSEQHYQTVHGHMQSPSYASAVVIRSYGAYEKELMVRIRIPQSYRMTSVTPSVQRKKRNDDRQIRVWCNTNFQTRSRPFSGIIAEASSRLQVERVHLEAAAKIRGL